MSLVQIILAFALGLVSLGLVVTVLMQPGKDKRLSGAIAGGADTFFSKSKAGRWDKVLGKVTVALCIVFFVIIIALFCIIKAGV